MKRYHCSALLSEMLAGRINGSNLKKLKQWVSNKPCRLDQVREECWAEIYIYYLSKPFAAGHEHPAMNMLRIATEFIESLKALHKSSAGRVWETRYKELEAEIIGRR